VRARRELAVQLAQVFGKQRAALSRGVVTGQRLSVRISGWANTSHAHVVGRAFHRAR
jgi:hypothetical protein